MFLIQVPGIHEYFMPIHFPMTLSAYDVNKTKIAPSSDKFRTTGLTASEVTQTCILEILLDIRTPIWIPKRQLQARPPLFVSASTVLRCVRQNQMFAITN